MGALFVAAACGRLEVGASLDAGAETPDADAQEGAFDGAVGADALVEDALAPPACLGRGEFAVLGSLAVQTARLAVGSSTVTYGPAEVDAGVCGPSGQGLSPYRRGPDYAGACTTASFWKGSGATFLGDDLFVAGYVGVASRESFGMDRVRWPSPGAVPRAEMQHFGVWIPSIASIVTRAVAHGLRDDASATVRFHVSGSAAPEPRAVVVSFDVSAGRPRALNEVAYEEPRLVSFDDLAGRGDGSFWASGRTADGGVALVRFGKDGSPDAAFGAQGLLAIPGTSDVRATKVLALADGGALLGAVTAAGEATVRRVTAAGPLDASYGQGGVVRAPFPVGGPVLEGRAQLALERSGAVRFAGADPTETGKDPNGYLFRAVKVARVLPTGSLDASFGDAGMARAVSATASRDPGAELHVLLEGSDDLDACAGKLAVGLVASTPGSSDYGGFVGTLVP